MLIDMIHDNHGEAPFKTRFRDPALLRSYGYEAIVIPDAIPTLPSLESDALVAPPFRSRAELEAGIDQRLNQAVAAGMKVFFYGDALLLPQALVQTRPADFLCDDHSGRLCPAKPAVLAAHQALVAKLFARWPQAAGLILRTGEVYPEATPHMLGNALHAAACPTCRRLSLTKRLGAFISAIYASTHDLGKTYVHRAWQPTPAGVPNMHDNPEFYRSVSAALPEAKSAPDLCISFKFTRGDFGAAGGGNPCLLADDRPKWIEFQCEREFEGKGAFPNFQPLLWQEFLAGLSGNRKLDTGNFSFWGWSRGGGWGGPYLQREEWLDANVFGLAALYRDCQHAALAPADVRHVALAWAKAALGMAAESPAVIAMADLLMLSRRAIDSLLHVRQLPAESTPPLLKDDLLDVNVIWTAAVRISDSPHAAEARQDKHDGLAAVEQMRRLIEAAAADLPNRAQARDLVNSLVYYNSFAGTVSGLFCGFVDFLAWNRTGRGNATLAQRAVNELEHAQAHWQHHTQRHALLPGAPSVFQETSFWERTNECLEQLQQGV